MAILRLLVAHVLVQEFTHQLGDGIAFGLQSEVTGVEQVELKRLQIALVWLGPSGREDLVVLAPRD
jgi:hypothetical protein